MPQLLGPDGSPISSKTLKKVKPPPLGEKFGQWAGDSYQIMGLPGGGAIAFDTSSLTLSDFRQMRAHYQINSSLTMLTFMMHQVEWHIECDNKKVGDLVERQLTDVWTRLVRAMSQALWAGYSPNALQWENDVTGREVVLNKIKDLVPEDCRVHWKEITTTYPGTQGAKATYRIFDGIDQLGAPGPITRECSYWYPLLMENGNHYGKRILESAFQPWFFSVLMHLFANRYYERYGEPTPIGRAPYDDEIDVEGTPVKGNKLMAMIIQQLRNRSTVVLPNDRTQISSEDRNPKFDYTLEYLESQMRGADFERYITRLDEEMSLAMFTPILMVRTADVGSYSLGDIHERAYKTMLNALMSDWAEYIRKYLIKPIVAYNFPRSKPVECNIVFSKMGRLKSELLQSIVTNLTQKGAIGFDVRELGEQLGLTVEEVETLAEVEPEKQPEEKAPPSTNASKIRELMRKRVQGQVERAARTERFDSSFVLDMGYKRQLLQAYEDSTTPDRRVDDFYKMMKNWSNFALSQDTNINPDSYMKLFEAQMDFASSVTLERL